MFHYFQLHMKKIFMAMLIVIIPSFCFYFIGVSERETKTVGEVFGKKINNEEFNDAYKAVYVDSFLKYGNYFKQMLPYLNLERETWFRLIMSKKAKEMSISVSDDELRSELMKMFSKDGTGNDFDPAMYDNFITKNLRMTIPEFEKMMFESLKFKKMEELVVKDVAVNDHEAEKYFREDHHKLQFSYALIDSVKYIDQVDLTDVNLKEFFSKDKTRFQIPEKISVNYIFKSNDDYKSKIQVTEQECKDFYEQNKDTYEIVEDKNEKQESETDKNNAVSDPEKQAEQSKVEISYKPFDSVKDEIKSSLFEQKLQAEAEAYFDGIYKSMIEKNSFTEVATANQLEIKTTSLFSRMDSPKEIGMNWSPQVKDAFELALNDFCGPYAVNNGWMIIQVKEKISSKIPETLEEVKKEVEKAYREDNAPQVAKKVSEELKGKILAKMDKLTFEEAIKAEGLEVKSSGFITVNTNTIKGLGFEPKLLEVIFALKESEVSQVLSIEQGKKFAFCQVNKREEPDLSLFQKDKNKYLEIAKTKKKKQVFEEWLKKVETEANVKIFMPVDTKSAEA